MTTTIEAARVEQLEAELRRTRTELAQANLQIGMLVRAAADNFDGAVRTVEWGVRLAGNPASLIEVGGGLLEAVQVNYPALTDGACREVSPERRAG